MVREAKSEASKVQLFQRVVRTDVVFGKHRWLFVVKRQLVVFYGLFLKASFLVEKSEAKWKFDFLKTTLNKTVCRDKCRCLFFPKCKNPVVCPDTGVFSISRLLNWLSLGHPILPVVVNQSGQIIIFSYLHQDVPEIGGFSRFPSKIPATFYLGVLRFLFEIGRTDEIWPGPKPSMYGTFNYIWLFLMVKYGKSR